MLFVGSQWRLGWHYANVTILHRFVQIVRLELLMTSFSSSEWVTNNNSICHALLSLKICWLFTLTKRYITWKVISERKVDQDKITRMTLNFTLFFFFLLQKSCYGGWYSTSCLCLSLDQDWGRPGDLWNLDIKWHMPSTEEREFVFYLLDLLLKPELQRLQKHTQGEQDMSRSATGYSDIIQYLCLNS